MRRHALHPFDRSREPMRMDLAAWLAILLGALLGLLSALTRDEGWAMLP